MLLHRGKPQNAEIEPGSISYLCWAEALLLLAHLSSRAPRCCVQVSLTKKKQKKRSFASHSLDGWMLLHGGATHGPLRPQTLTWRKPLTSSAIPSMCSR